MATTLADHLAPVVPELTQRKPHKRPEWHFVALLLLPCVMLALHLDGRLVMRDVGAWDAATYYKMSSSPSLEPVLAPFAYRWIPHKVVAMVPLPPKRTYELVAWGGLWASAAVLFLLLRRTGLDADMLLLLVTLFFVWARWGGRFYTWYRAGTEPTAYLILVCGLLACHRRSLGWLAVVGFIGGFCREHVVLLFPYFFLLNARPGKLWKTGLSLAAAALPMVVVLGSVRVLTPITADLTAISGLLAQFQTKVAAPGALLRIVVCTLGHAGLLVPLLLLFPRLTLHHARRMPHVCFWIAGTWALGIFAGGDTDRLMYYAFPAELLLLCRVFRSAGVDFNRRWGPFLLAMIIGQMAVSQCFAQEVMAANVFVGWNARVVAAWSLALLILKPRKRVRSVFVQNDGLNKWVGTQGEDVHRGALV